MTYLLSRTREWELKLRSKPQYPFFRKDDHVVRTLGKNSGLYCSECVYRVNSRDSLGVRQIDRCSKTGKRISSPELNGCIRGKKFA